MIVYVQIGRTARAGADGHVTSLYTAESRHLVGAIQQAIEADQPVEGAFSRNRSFRHTIKKYGHFVPRDERIKAA